MPMRRFRRPLHKSISRKLRNLIIAMVRLEISPKSPNGAKDTRLTTTVFLYWNSSGRGMTGVVFQSASLVPRGLVLHESEISY